MLVLNLMPATLFKQVGQDKVVEAPKTPVWNIPQVYRLICKR